MKIAAPNFFIAQIILSPLLNDGISGHPRDHPLLSQRVYRLLSCNTAHLLLLTLGNAVSWEREKKAGWLLRFGELSFEYHLIATRRAPDLRCSFMPLLHELQTPCPMPHPAAAET
jgi:hypothetical protein